jgi:hypothetical protein
MNQSEDHDAHQPFPVEEEAHGAVVEWLARDSRGHVAIFTAVASADILPPGLEELEEHRRALAAILEVPPTTRSVFGPPVGNERGDRWRALVERGLFVFAAYRSGGPYWIAEAPQLPLHVLDLPAWVGELVERQVSLSLPFKHVASVMPDSLGHPRQIGMTGQRLS